MPYYFKRFLLVLISLSFSAFGTENNLQSVEKQEIDQLLSNIERSVSSMKQKVNENLEILDEALQDFDQFEPAVASLKSFSLSQGGLLWPVSGSLLHSYGSRRINHEAWRGVYIATEPEAIVRASHHGKVIFSDWLKGFGLLLVIEHQQGYVTLYGNNAVLMRGVGEKVKAGEIIAMTGFGAEGHGLYFEIRKNGQPVDPVKWLARR